MSDRGRACCRRAPAALLCALALVLGSPAVAPAAGKGTPPVRAAFPSVSLHGWATSLGCEASWVVKNKKLRVKNSLVEIIFERDRREISVNGLRVFLGEAPQAGARTLTISPVDRDRLLLPLLAPGQFTLPRPVRTIVLDAGHGGKDNGRTNAELKVHEKNAALDVVQRLQSRLAARGYRVVLTRADDTFIELKDRPARAAQGQADLFLSVHFNATTASTVHGIETYALTPQYQRSTASEQAMPDDAIGAPGNAWDVWNALLGFTMHRRLDHDLGRFDRGLKRARFVVIRDLATCPGVLMECGFLTNPAEAKLIATTDYREQLATVIAAGVDDYVSLLSAPGTAKPSPAVSAPSPSTPPRPPGGNGGAIRAPRPGGRSP